MTTIYRLILITLLFCTLIISSSHSMTLGKGLAMKPDPPFAIDGQLGDWASVPGVFELNTEKFVTFGKDSWSSSADLSARVMLAWREDCLYVAADITDDKVFQANRGGKIYMGDHIELNIDTTPDVDTGRKIFGEGQFVIAISPGNFSHTGDIFVDIPAEAYQYMPANKGIPDVVVAAIQTEKGYIIEAAIPFKILGISNAVIATQMPMEVGISDTDSPEPAQDTMLTLLPQTWERTRERMVNFVLAGADGKAPEVVSGVDIFSDAKILQGGKQDITFDVPNIPAGKESVLSLLARIEWPEPAGYTPGMRLLLNGMPLDGKRLLNKEPIMEAADGRMFSMAAGEIFYTFYAPSFEILDSDWTKYGLKKARAAAFDLKVTDLLKKGPNTLTLENVLSAEFAYPIIFGAGKIEFRAPIQPKPKPTAPTGQLPIIWPMRKTPKFTAAIRKDGIEIKIGKELLLVESTFSTPAPAWVKGSNKYFSFKREIKSLGEVIVVKDTFQNLTDENLPLMQRHSVKIAGLKNVRLAGVPLAGKNSSASNPQNPTVFGTDGQIGIGLMPLDDVSRVHITNLANDETIGMADNQLILKPKASHTTEWVVLPTAPDYYDFVNAARRLLGVNFTIPGGFAFVTFRPHDSGSFDAKQWADFVRLKDAKIVGNGYFYPTYKGLSTMHSVGYHDGVDHSYEKSELDRLKKATPNTNFQCYFHCYLELISDYWEKYASDRLILSDGRQGFYSGNTALKLYLPTSTNTWGRDIAKTIDYALDTVGYDGIYWDELEYSSYQYHYGEPWDGVSGDINPITMKIDRLKTSVTLISQDYRIGLVKKIFARGASLVGNGAPHTRTMTNMHFPRFTETGSITNCVQTHLYTPIALGDHLTERSEEDCYRWMVNALNYGCVYYWYTSSIIPTYPTLSSYMFPITPIELHEGYIIGKERILTNRSGVFGWGDKSKHETHIFDDEGKEVLGFKSPKVLKSGMTYTEIRIPEGWSAAIVRK